eukprot:SM000268S09733  [mRNA]  locus=s268:108051:111110:+ [translate_table: standard]
MGARVGIFDADVYGPSLPTMVSPDMRVLQMDAETRAITPTEYHGVKLVSFGFAGQGSAIMRGPMVSGVVNQLLTTTAWGDLDYLVIDMPPGTGDIQLTICQAVPLTAAVIVTTPQKLAFIDVAKGVRMFSKLKILSTGVESEQVPCVAVVENMCYFDGDEGRRYYPFGQGSGAEVVRQFGIPHLFEMPIRPELSAAGDSGQPEVLSNPGGEVAAAFSSIGACVVQQCAKLRQQVATTMARVYGDTYVASGASGQCFDGPVRRTMRTPVMTAVVYDAGHRALRVRIPGSSEEFLLHPATVRRNDRSAQSIDEWTGEQRLRYADVPEDIEPQGVRPMGNYAVEITWPDGFNQVAPFDHLQSMERLVTADSPATVGAGVAGTTATQEEMPLPAAGAETDSTADSPTSLTTARSAARSILEHAEELRKLR